MHVASYDGRSRRRLSALMVENPTAPAPETNSPWVFLLFFAETFTLSGVSGILYASFLVRDFKSPLGGDHPVYIPIDCLLLFICLLEWVCGGVLLYVVWAYPCEQLTSQKQKLFMRTLFAAVFFSGIHAIILFGAVMSDWIQHQDEMEDVLILCSAISCFLSFYFMVRRVENDNAWRLTFMED